MKELFELFRRFDARRIFGFIRRLGGMSCPKVKCYDLRSTHALRVEGDVNLANVNLCHVISIHALRVEGDQVTLSAQSRRGNFYPRPPSGGRPRRGRGEREQTRISIHALRVEGDSMSPSTTGIVPGFLSTPSGWRATWTAEPQTQKVVLFLSTPSGWRATR